MSKPTEDWAKVLTRLEENDPMAVAKVMEVIVGYLHHYKAYDRRSSWEDLCQEVLVALVRSLRRGAIRDPGAFIAYAGTVTRNKLANWAQRKDHSKRELPFEEEQARAALRKLSGASRARSPDLLMDLERALAKLPDRCRRVIEAIYLQGYSYQEASQQLGLSLSAVKREQIKGLKHLREDMEIRR